MTIQNRIAALERRTTAGRLGMPALIVRPEQTEQEAAEEYEALHGHPPPDDILTIHVTRARAPDD